jgi:hypothetical protein
MYEMQGPHVAWQRIDLPISQPVSASPSAPPYLLPVCDSWFPRVPHNPWGRPRRWAAVQVVNEFLLPRLGGAQVVLIKLFKILLLSTRT